MVAHSPLHVGSSPPNPTTPDQQLRHYRSRPTSSAQFPASTDISEGSVIGPPKEPHSWSLTSPLGSSDPSPRSHSSQEVPSPGQSPTLDPSHRSNWSHLPVPYAPAGPSSSILGFGSLDPGISEGLPGTGVEPVGPARAGPQDSKSSARQAESLAIVGIRERRQMGDSFLVSLNGVDGCDRLPGLYALGHLLTT